MIPVTTCAKYHSRVRSSSSACDSRGCQVSTEHDGLVKIEELEPESRAMVVDFAVLVALVTSAHPASRSASSLSSQSTSRKQEQELRRPENADH